MSEKRVWFQIHLLTAVVMMFVAGALLGLNLTKHTQFETEIGYGSRWNPEENDYDHYFISQDVSYKGWPLNYVRATSSADLNFVNYNYWFLCIDAFLALMILYMAIFTFESFYRRREGRAP